jgi:hypothetical protein
VIDIGPTSALAGETMTNMARRVPTGTIATRPASQRRDLNVLLQDICLPP